MQQGIKSEDYTISHSRNVTHHESQVYMEGVKWIASAMPLVKYVS